MASVFLFFFIIASGTLFLFMPASDRGETCIRKIISTFFDKSAENVQRGNKIQRICSETHKSLYGLCNLIFFIIASGTLFLFMPASDRGETCIRKIISTIFEKSAKNVQRGNKIQRIYSETHKTLYGLCNLIFFIIASGTLFLFMPASDRGEPCIRKIIATIFEKSAKNVSPR